MTVQEICINIDRSGSMMGKETDTVGGINCMLNELKESKNDEDTIRVSIKLFDHEEIIKKNRVDISEIEEFPLSDFIPRGQTALLDSLGNSLRYFMEKKLMNPDEYDTCLIYLATDGYENCSKNHTKNDIKKLIKNAEEKYNIKVIYLGANQDAILEANNIGISSNTAINYDETSDAVNAVYRSAAAVASRNRSDPSQQLSFNDVERQSSQPSQQFSENNNNVPEIRRQNNIQAGLPSPINNNITMPLVTRQNTFMLPPPPPTPMVHQNTSA